MVWLSLLKTKQIYDEKDHRVLDVLPVNGHGQDIDYVSVAFPS